MRFLSALEAGSRRSGYLRLWVLLRPLSQAFRRCAPVCTSVSKCPLLVRTPVIGSGRPQWSRSITSVKTYFQIRSHSQVLGLTLPIRVWGTRELGPRLSLSLVLPSTAQLSPRLGPEGAWKGSINGRNGSPSPKTGGGRRAWVSTAPGKHASWRAPEDVSTRAASRENPLRKAKLP